jgi:TRAP-type C4-dicarboxylate transport system substrate-binding protein
MRAIPDAEDGTRQARSEGHWKEASVNARLLPGRTWLLLTAALAIGATACGAGNLDRAGNPIPKPLVLTLADSNGDTSDAQPFANAVSSLSHGSLQIKIEGSWRLSDPTREADLIKDVRAGKADLGITASRAFDAAGISSFQALQAPFLINSYPLERKVLDSAIPAQMLQGLRPHDLVGLAVLPGPLWRPLGFTRPLVAAFSYRGARIGIGRSAVDAGIFRALGAVPVTPRRRGSEPAIGGLTGVENSASAIDVGFAAPGAILTGNVVFEPLPSVLFMNQRAFGLLTASERGVLLRAAARARSAGIYQGNDTASVADLCRRGIKVVSASPADLTAMRAAVQPVYRILESDPSTKAYISQITAMRPAAGGSPGAVACPAAAATGGIVSSAAELHGTWQVTYTENELIAAGADSNELQPSQGNFGHFTLTFSQGRWWWRNTGGDPAAIPNNKYAYGTYVVIGSKINFYRHDNAYPGSDTEIWGPFIWSVWRDTLTFKRDGWTGGTQGPSGLTVKPWSRIGA